jgi:mono/diheme cytochrome c family protein
MPAWAEFLSDAEIQDVSRYLVVFSPRFIEAWKSSTKPNVIAASAPPSDLTALVGSGAELWKRFQCATCHGADGRGHGEAAATLKDEWDNPIRATDLTYSWSFKNGRRPEDIYRTLIGGINGTPMPSYASAFSDEKSRWAMVAYILSLSPAERPVMHLRDFAKARLGGLGTEGHVLGPSDPRRASR